jgi:hypothetical protein
VRRTFKQAILYSFGVSLLVPEALIAQNAQSHKAAATCGSEEHPGTWMQCPPVDDPPDRVACQEVNVCLPNCPEGYRQLSASADSVIGKPACVLGTNSRSTCLPLNFQLVRRAALLVWYLRGEISERCALSHLRTPIEPVTVEVAEGLQGEAIGHFRIVVGENGRLTDFRLLDFYFTALPSRNNPLDSLATPSEMAAAMLKRLRYRPYIYRGRPIEFESPISVHFRLRNKAR